MVPPVNIIQQQPSPAGRILSQISRHSTPAQVSGTSWAPGTRPVFTPQVAQPEPPAAGPGSPLPSRPCCPWGTVLLRSPALCPCFLLGADPAALPELRVGVDPGLLFLSRVFPLLQQVASQTVKTRAPSFGMGTFQGTPSSFGSMAAPGSTASPTTAPYPALASRGTGFSEWDLGGKQPWQRPAVGGCAL